MIPFAPIPGPQLLQRVQDVARKAFALCQSAQDVANAIVAIFTSAQDGTQTLTLGTTAPDGIQTLTPTRWVVITESDGKQTTIPGWR